MARRQTPVRGWVGTLDRVLNHQVTRALLSIAIVISLIPHDWMHASDLVFLVVFVPEFVARAIVASRRESSVVPDPHRPTGWRFPRSSDFFFLVVDFVALASFFPWAQSTTRWLRLFRLTRTVMLLRYWAPLVKDLWSVFRRRERSRQLTLMIAAVAIVAFAGTVLLNHATDEVGEDFDGDGNIGDEHDHVFWVRMYWALRQIEDPGNMLTSPHEFATLVVSIGLTFFGLFLVSFLIGLGTDAVGEVMQLSKLRSPGLKRHTVLLNVTQATRALVHEALGENQKVIPDGLTPLSPRWFAALRRNAKQQREFVVVGKDEEPPEFMREPEYGRIIYRENSDDDDEAFLDRADVPLARRIVLLADVEADEPDDETVRTLITMVERLHEVGTHDDGDNRTSLIAEILDESNIGAATRAIARASDRVDAHIIPTEHLLALFAFSVARQPRASALFFELLASNGHELYSYDYRQSETTGKRVPSLHADPAAALETLYWQGLGRQPDRRVLPLGILVADPASNPRLDADVVLNPSPGQPDRGDQRQFAGFVALAPNSKVAADFAADVLANPSAPAPSITPGAFAPPNLLPPVKNPLRRVLLCGFRPATVNLIESILSVEPDAEVLVLVRDERARLETLDAFAGHTNLVRTGLLSGVRGKFVSTDDPYEFRCTPGGRSDLISGRIVVEVGDWTSSRQLLKLPRDFGTAAGMDLVMFASSERHSSDAATATALMKIEHLREHARDTTAADHRQTIVAELINAELAHRLERRYAAMGRTDVVVFSIHELRAFFMFQSVVVPNFNLIYAELLAAWGQGFVRLQAEGGQGQCTFEQLAALLHTQGKALFAVEVSDERGAGKLFIAQGDPDRDGIIELSRLEAIWVVSPEGSSTTTAPHQPVATAQPNVPPTSSPPATATANPSPVAPEPSPRPVAPPVMASAAPGPASRGKTMVPPSARDEFPAKGQTVVGPMPTAEAPNAGPMVPPAPPKPKT